MPGEIRLPAFETRLSVAKHALRVHPFMALIARYGMPPGEIPDGPRRLEPFVAKCIIPLPKVFPFPAFWKMIPPA